MALNSVQKFLVSLFAIPQQTTIVKDVEISKQNEELRKQLAYSQGQIGRLNKLVRKQSKEKEDSEVRQEIAERLYEETEKLEKEEMGEYIPLDGLFSKIYDFDIKKKSKFGEKLVFTDRNEEGEYKYGSMGFTTKGLFLIKDNKGNIINYASLPRRLFKIEGIRNQIKKGMIRMNVDKDGEYHAEIEQLEIPNQIYDEETHQIAETEEMRVKAINLIREKIMENRFLSSKVEQFEIAFGDMARELNSVKSQLVILSKTNNIATADFTAMIDKVTEMSKQTFQMSEKIVNLSETTAIQEDKIESLESVNEKLRKKAEIVESQTDFEKTKGLYEDITDSALGRQKEIKKENA